jgi:RHS repeat-associated protein
MMADIVTVLPTGVDGRVRRLGYGFDDQGRPTTATSYADTAGTVVLNQNVTTFGAWGDIARVSQNHDGAVVPGSPTITYSTTEQLAQNGEAGAVRRTAMSYPSGNRTVYQYFGTAGSIDDRLSRIVAQAADAAASTRYTTHEYLGAGRIVSVAHPQITGGLTYTLSHTTALDGLDRFDRTVDLGWKKNNGTYVDRFQYGYDAADRRTWKKIAATAAPTSLNDFVTYDRNDRAVTYGRGSLAGNSPNYTGVSSPSVAESWSNDALGNDRNYSRNTGASNFTQSKAFNTFNEIDIDDVHGNVPGSSITGTAGVGGTWVSPMYDATGNATRLPMLGAETAASNARLLTWDAWNRLGYAYVDSNGNAIVDGGDLVAGIYFYDAAHRRITKITQVTVSSWTRHDFLVNENWQIVEARRSSGATSSLAMGSSALLHNLWGVRFIDCLAMQWRDTDGNGSFESSFAITSDASFSTTAVVTGAGTVVERSLYDLYGGKATLNASFVATAPNGNLPATAFTGREEDTETGLVYFRARMFAPVLDRFISRDPSEYVDGYNMYLAYFSPNNLDPSGRIVETGWDLFNVATGFISLGCNVASGNVVGALVDVAGLGYDILATAVPGLPAGGSVAIKAARAANAIKKSELVVTAARTAEKVFTPMVKLKLAVSNSKNPLVSAMYKTAEKVGDATSLLRYAVREGLDEAHHIFPRNWPGKLNWKDKGLLGDLQQIRDTLTKAIDIAADAKNGVSLPSKVHGPLHTQEYARWLVLNLKPLVGNPTAMAAKLDDMALELLRNHKGLK